MKLTALPIALLAATALALATLPTIPAAADGTATISLKLVTLSGRAITKPGSHTGVYVYEGSSIVAHPALRRGVATFSFPAGTDYHVSVTRAAPYVDVTLDAEPAVAAGERSVVKLPLAKGAVISGTVLSIHGSPIAHANVSLLANEGSGGAFGKTDSHGRYSFTGIASGAYSLQFNPIFYVNGGTPPKTTPAYPWAYLKNRQSYPLALSQDVNQQSVSSAATVLKEKTARIHPSGRIIATFTPQEKGVIDSWTGAWSTLPDDETDTAIGGVNSSDTGFSLRPIAGDYTVWVDVGSTQFFYTGDGQQLSTDIDDAKTVVAGTKDVHITFGDLPPA